jgi:pimeloyl-ACP methyl ester carboxylesterase
MKRAREVGGQRVLDIDGRKLSYAEFGTPDGFPVIALHGTPGSRIKYAVAHEAAVRLGLRLISPDRWGYGRSDAPARPALADYARDVGALADALGLERFALLAISGGSPYAVATAAKLNGRVSSLALVSPMGPVTFRTQMRLFHRFCFLLLPRVPGASVAVFRFYRRLLSVRPDVAIRVASVATIRVDKDLIRTPEISQALVETFRSGLAHGVAGPAIDLQMFSRPWGVALGDIKAPTRVWLGTVDRNVPQSAARQLAELIPAAQLTLLPAQGHLWISRNYGEVLEWVARQSTESNQSR